MKVLAPIPLIHCVPVADQIRRIEHIQKTMALEYGISIPDMLSMRKHSEVSDARMIAMWISTRLAGARPHTIAGVFKRDKHAVKRAVDVINNRMETDRTFEAEVSAAYVRVHHFLFPGMDIEII